MHILIKHCCWFFIFVYQLWRGKVSPHLNLWRTSKFFSWILSLVMWLLLESSQLLNWVSVEMNNELPTFYSFAIFCSHFLLRGKSAYQLCTIIQKSFPLFFCIFLWGGVFEYISILGHAWLCSSTISHFALRDLSWKGLGYYMWFWKSNSG